MNKNRIDATVLYNRRAGPDCYRMGIAAGSAYDGALPGQFVMLRLKDRSFPLLRRPFSIHRRLKDGFELLYKVVGAGTRCLAACRKGHRVDVLGPLGRGFPIDANHRCIFMAAGGIGVAPIFFLAQVLQNSAAGANGRYVFLGARTREELLCVDEMRAMGLEVSLSTDDGSAGEKGMVTSALAAAAARRRPDAVYACGPPAMLRQVAETTARLQLPCWLSIESVMACGVGACLGCAVPGRDAAGPYLHVCSDGPVFDAAQLRFNAA